MNISKINNTNFEAGNVYLKRVNSPKTLKCYNAVKKLADDKDMDIVLIKTKESKYLPQSDMYLVIAQKEVPTEEILKHGTGCAILSKKAGAEELSTKIYNAVIKAVETLETKLKGNKAE